ncbi:glycosyltransferase family A protein [Leptothoe sp. ISB3NOV94-8A]|uniref:Glycosyltransferase family 2 protein n=1 Tax=Adonisia turfae CCMR0081 TaxID=2292702 RepID=A0A6M0RI03_9CYAN|nr:glycosyltransferase family A protein [Adonisia turfae]NEZ55795.1 glycosyltransferase family 2 protein [Adonisia turfae CCMR0081]
MKKVSIVIPLYNTEKYVRLALESALAQTYQNLEIIVVDDGSTDEGVTICQQFTDDRIRIIQQENRGLSGARNTGIRHAEGEYVAFLDADDLWVPEKVERHVEHFEKRPEIGISFSYSTFIDENGTPLGIYQISKVSQITPLDILCRTPIGNGSAAVFRKEVFENIKFPVQVDGIIEEHYFDEAFRESQDVECWMRVAIKTKWIMEGLAEPLTLYRVNSKGISANLTKKMKAWERLLNKVRSYAPEEMEQWEKPAMAYHCRHLARRAVTLKDGGQAMKLFSRAIATYAPILIEEPFRTFLTGAAASALWILPINVYQRLFEVAANLTGSSQRRRMTRYSTVYQSSSQKVAS